MPGLVLSQVQNFAFPFVEMHEVPVGLVLQPVEASLNGSTAIYCIRFSTTFQIVDLSKILLSHKRGSVPTVQ